MRPITMMQAQWKADTKEGESLQFEACKGGFFSDIDEYGLKIVGKTAQDSLSGSNLANPMTGYRSNGGNTTTTVILKDADKYSNCITYCFSVKEGASYIIDKLGYWSRYFWFDDNPLLENNLNALISIGGGYGPQTEGQCFYNQIVTAPTNAKYLFVTATADNTIDNFTTFQCNKGTTLLPYEPYCGGIPSPNPDYPQEIQCVKAGTKVQVCGKNLFNDVVEFTKINNSFNGLGFGLWEQQTDGAWHVLNIGAYTNFPLWTNTTNKSQIRLEYTLKNQNPSQNPYSGYLRFVYTDGSYSNVGAASYLEFTKVYGVSDANKTVEKIVFYYNNDPYFTFFKDIMITTDLEASYEPYQGNEIIVPCDLYEGDVWYPMSGKVKKQTQISTIREVTTYIPKRYEEYIWFQDVDAKTVANSKIWCATHKGELTWWFEGYAIQPHLTNLTSSTVYFSLKYTDLGKEYNKNTEDAVIINAANRYLTERGGIPYICTRRETLIKQYDPQPIFAPMGTVNVLQQPTDLSADLSATVLVRR